MKARDVHTSSAAAASNNNDIIIVLATDGVFFMVHTMPCILRAGELEARFQVEVREAVAERK